MSNNYWIENDLVKHGKDSLNTIQSNQDPKSFVCYLYMENQKYFITDLMTKLHSTLSTKVRFKGVNRPQNNKKTCLQISIKKYLYSAQLKYIFIFIDDLHSTATSSLIDFKDIGLAPSELKNGTDLVENIFGRTQKTSQASLIDATLPRTLGSTLTGDRNSHGTLKQNPGDLTQMVNQFSQADSLANYTIDMEESREPKVPVNLNLNEAFCKNSQELQIESKSKAEQTVEDSLLAFTDTDNSGQKISSQLNDLGSFQSISNLSCINDTEPFESVSHLSKKNKAPNGSSIEIIPRNLLNPKDHAPPTNGFVDQTGHDALQSVHSTVPRLSNRGDKKSPIAADAEQKLNTSSKMVVSEDLSIDHLTNDEMNSSFSSNSSQNDFAIQQMSLSSPRKKKLMHSRISDRFYDNDKDQMTEDESKDDSDKSYASPTNAAAASGISPSSPYPIPKRLNDRTDRARLSSSSDSSSVRSISLSNSVSVVPKSSLFASKQRYLLQEQKSYSDSKKITHSLTTSRLFSPISKHKQPNVRCLLNQLNNSLAAAEKTEQSNILKDKQVKLAINKSEQLLRRKRLFNPSSQKVEEAFEHDGIQPEKLVYPSPGSKDSFGYSHNGTDWTNDSSSRRSIPAGQAANSTSYSTDKLKDTSASLLFEKSIKFNSLHSAQNTQENLLKHKFKLEANHLQNYLRSLIKSTQTNHLP